MASKFIEANRRCKKFSLSTLFFTKYNFRHKIFWLLWKLVPKKRFQQHCSHAWVCLDCTLIYQKLETIGSFCWSQWSIINFGHLQSSQGANYTMRNLFFVWCTFNIRIALPKDLICRKGIQPNQLLFRRTEKGKFRP